jgi:hypothetical protein
MLQGMRAAIAGFLVVAAVFLGLVGGTVSADLVGAGARAPEIAAGPWVNSSPLTLAGLRGRVVLVEFWTYG